MFGQNPVSRARLAADGFMVKAIFYTIQGEGPWAGRPTIFLRFAGCNLRCYFCDTDFGNGQLYQADELAHALIDMAEVNNCTDFVLTGGEPLLQPLGDLLYRMPMNFNFQIETAGTVWPPGLAGEAARRLVIVCSPKTPRVHAHVAKVTSAWKYIIQDGMVAADDGLPMMSTQMPGEPQRLYRPENGAPIYVQACDEYDPEKNHNNLSQTVQSALRYGYRLSIQMHKIAGLD